ncbi:tripartite tricarboxylate transporter TctB family protein [Halomonas halmophila]|nr:tripartite tricarboxylate transporter TctB family protein [Halomonas halmophila]
MFEVSVSFEQSHLFFPRIITWALVLMLGVILIKHRNALLPGLKRAGEAVLGKSEEFHWTRFFGTLTLTTAYFYLMYVVGGIFPNTGYGFLFMSVPFIFCLSLLYVDQKTWKNLAIIAATAVIAPLLVWFMLAHLFGITLP